jgi:hypothetical protein
MYPSFPRLAEAIAAERAADFQRDAEAYRRARRVKRRSIDTDRTAVPLHGASSRVPAGAAHHESCSASRAI